MSSFFRNAAKCEVRRYPDAQIVCTENGVGGTESTVICSTEGCFSYKTLVFGGRILMLFWQLRT